MSKPTILTVDSDHFRRFDTIGTTSAVLNKPALLQTVLRVKNGKGCRILTVKTVKWSKYKFINAFIRFWIRIKY